MATRRFIAGAVCPACGEADKLVLLLDSRDRRRECVRCGYSDSLEDGPAPAEPVTRVNQARTNRAALPHEDEIKVLRIADNADGGRE